MQALFRRWKKLHLSRAPRDALWMSWILTKVPASLWPEALKIILSLLKVLPPSRFPKALEFVSYLRKTWLPLKDIVSTVHTPVRTNNVAESFNRYIVKRLGGVHPNICSFVCIITL